MPAKRALAEPRDVVYLYDGGLAGFFNCVYESVYEHELPAAIVTEQDPQPSLMLQKRIAADPGRAVRVRNSIPKKISPRALELMENVFLSCMEKKEIHTLRFLLLGYEQGPRVLSMLGHPDVAPLLAAERHLGGECHLLKGFIRFSDYGGDGSPQPLRRKTSSCPGSRAISWRAIPTRILPSATKRTPAP